MRFLPFAAIGLMGLVATTAHAQQTLYQDDFECSNVIGFGSSGLGWAANWASDDWSTTATAPLTLDGVAPYNTVIGGSYGPPVDEVENFLLTGHSLIEDTIFEVTANNDGTGTMGTIARYDATTGNYYACYSGVSDVPSCGLPLGGGSYIIEYQAGSTCVAVAAAVVSDTSAPPAGVPFGIRMTVQNSSITCEFDYDGDGSYSGAADRMLAYSDPTPLGPGLNGLFTMGTGLGNGLPYFDDVTLETWDTDTDFDGLPDAVEAVIGTDAGLVDTDGDGLTDREEVGMAEYPRDSDGDSIIDALETDSDNDGYDDWLEAAQGGPSDCGLSVGGGDGLPDWADTDSDGDNWADSIDLCPWTFSGQGDADGDGLGTECDPDDNNLDTDGDFLQDDLEVLVYGTDPTNADTDGGGEPDGSEVSAMPTPRDPLNPVDDQIQDSDNDGLSDVEEYGLCTDPSNPDSDGDGLLDGDEVDPYVYGTDPCDPDTDADGLEDGDEITAGCDPFIGDTDGDTIGDAAEEGTGGYGTQCELADTDGDTLTDPDEIYLYTTNPLDPDTDGDTLDDAFEVTRDSDGNSIIDALQADDDSDGVPTIDEDANGTAPILYADTDGDSILDYRDEDDDGDGILTIAEDTNGNGDFFDDDADGDGIPSFLDDNEEEANRDTDLDGILDNDEEAIGSDPFSPDSDGDGIPDGDEIGDVNSPTDTDQDGFPDIIDSDDDGDGLATENELQNGEPVDTDGDGLPDHLDPDRDNDGVNDGRDPAPDNRGGDGTGQAPKKPSYGFGMGCNQAGGTPVSLGWAFAVLALVRRRQR